MLIVVTCLLEINFSSSSSGRRGQVLVCKELRYFSLSKTLQLDPQAMVCEVKIWRRRPVVEF